MSPPSNRTNGMVQFRDSERTVTECQSLCANDTTCAGYYYVAEDRETSGICFTTSIWDMGPPEITTLPVKVGGRCGPNLPTIKGDFTGNDLSNAPAPNAAECSYKCEATTGCMAYSWTNYNEGTCWMKTARTSETYGPFDGSVLSGEVYRCGSTYADQDIDGEDLTSVQRADWRDCCGVCRRTSGCVASSWNNYNGGTCWLKKTKKGYKTVRGVISMSLAV